MSASAPGQARLLDTSELWGQAFEIAVKRGVIAFLADQGLVDFAHPQLRAWAGSRTSKLYAAMRDELHVVDDNLIARVNAALAHLLVLGYGLGWTCLREYLAPLERPLAVKALWCPLSLPRTARDREADATVAAEAFRSAFALEGHSAHLTQRGEPAWSDFTLWLTSGRKSQSRLLVLAFSYNVPAELLDFSKEEAHLEELTRYARLMDSRGVFSRVCARGNGRAL